VLSGPWCITSRKRATQGSRSMARRSGPKCIKSLSNRKEMLVIF